jgi:hypothetical protein
MNKIELNITNEIELYNDYNKRQIKRIILEYWDKLPNDEIRVENIHLINYDEDNKFKKEKRA